MIQMRFKFLPSLILTLILVAMTLFPAGLFAEIYSYTDEDGVRHFSNVPTSPRYRICSMEMPLRSSFRFHSYSSGRNAKAYDAIIREACRHYGTSFELVKAVIHVESGFNPNAVSRAGALGLMQIMPYNLNDFGVLDPFDPRDNVMGGTWYLKQLMEKYNSDLTLSLAAYNAGPGAVDKYRDIPPFPETEDYVQRVLTYYRHYQNQHP
jgi:soluble lytic murein transglycosylase